MDRIVGIRQAAAVLGVSISTLRRWEARGKIVVEHTAGGHRRYNLSKLRPELVRSGDRVTKKTVAYARVSSPDQKEDLERQNQVLESYCTLQGWKFELVSDLGSGMNYRKRGLQKLLNEIIDDKVGRLVLNHKDRLLRFGAELVFAVCEMKGVEIVILNQGEDTSFEQDLANDLLEMIAVCSARLYGARSQKNQKLVEAIRAATEDAA